MKPKLLNALLIALVLASHNHALAQPAVAAKTAFETPLALDNLDLAAFAQWTDGAETPVALKDGPRHVSWTQNSAPEWDGVRFGASNTPGVRHLRIAFKAPLAIGSVLVRAGGQLSVLKAAAPYPGNLADDAQWIPATRLKGGEVSRAEAGNEDYALWTLPPNTSTRALRFTHTAAPTDNTYAGWLGGIFVMSERMTNIAPQAVATTSARDEVAAKINNGSNDGTWGIWDNGAQGAALPVAERPEWIILTWPRAVSLRGLNALWAGFGATDVQAYSGPADKHPREAGNADWKTIRTFDAIENQYPRALGPNWMDFGQTVTTRAIRLRLTQVTKEGHGHLNGNTKGGKRVWLGELMALQPLDAADVKTAILPPLPVVAAPHPPIPIRFTLPTAGYVTLVIEGQSGKRVRNLVAETLFPAGPNVVWWDGMDDLLRDEEAAKHGLYHIPAQFVQPGAYRVRGLYRKAIDLHYEFSIYSAGQPAWETADGTGGWLTNHTPPSSALFVPARAAPGGKPLVYLGSYISEGGSGLAWVSLNGRKQGGRGWIGGNWTAAPYLARDAGDKAAPDAFAYVGAAWEGELRLTALTAGGDKAILKPPFKFPGTTEQEKKDSSMLGGIAVHNGLLAASLPKQNQLLLVDAALHAQRAVVPLTDGRGLAFDNQGRLLALSGTKLLRYTLPASFSAATRLSSVGWTASASTRTEEAAKAIDADANSRWSTNAAQAPGQWFSLDMKAPQTFSRVVLSSSADRDLPSGYEVAVSDDGQLWNNIAAGQGAPSVTSINLPPTSARFLKITQTGTTTDSFWSLNALELFNVPAGANAAAFPAPQVLVDNLEDPQGITLDAAGNIYVSDRGNSHQVKVFEPTGKLLRAIGHAGAPKAGPYDAQHMNNPKGLAIDAENKLWVAEEDYQPKRVSVWTTEGKFVNAFYGPSEYGGGGTLDPQDKTRFYYHGIEFKLDWKTGANAPVNVLFRPGPQELPVPNGYGSGGVPETPLYLNGRRYLTNCFNSNPTNGAAIAMLWLEKNGIAVPVAALGHANDWDLLKGDIFKPRWPAGVDLKGDRGKNQTAFCWSDASGDGLMQPDEVTFVKKATGGITVMPDLSFVASRVDDASMRFAPQKFTAQGVPLYDLSAGQTLVAGAQPPASSGGDQALVGTDGWTIHTNAPKPFSPFSLGGSKNGAALWSYPSPWPGLHASHEAPPPSFPGQVIGHTRLIGNMVTPKRGEAGPLWAVNGNMGNMYIFTQDGLFVAQLFQDVRQAKTWTMPIAERNMRVNNLSLHDENFWPTINQTSDGQIYLNSSLPNIVRVDGLESIRRLPAMPLRVTADDLKNAQSYFVQSEAQRQQNQGTGTLQVALRAAPPVVDGKLDDWAGSDWASIDKSGVAANFDSNSKPYDVAGAVTIAGDRLYAAWRTGDANLLRNTGEVSNAPFKTGGALDLMLGANPAADAKRPNPVEGDARLLITQVKGKTLAMLYRAVVPGTKEPVPFSSPWRTINIDRVDDISDKVQFASADGNYEISIPIAALNLKADAGQSIKGDIGILRGNGFQTLQRVYWSNKATGITADVPSEAQLTPQLWGKWEFKNAP